MVSGEVWHSDVHKLEVVDEDAGRSGLDIRGSICSERKIVRGRLIIPCGVHDGQTMTTKRMTWFFPDDGGLIALSQSFESVKRHRIRGEDGIFSTATGCAVMRVY